MSDERIWLADEAGDLISEDQEQLLIEAGFEVQRASRLDSSGGEPPTILLGPPQALESMGADHPAALTIGLIDATLEAPSFSGTALRTPLHPVALRALVDALRYGGEDRRWSHRVALGLGARMWTRSGPAKVTIADLSVAGARLMVSKAVDPGRRLVLWLPGPGRLGLPKRVSGRVLRCEAEPQGDVAGFALGVEWTSTSSAGRRRLHALLEEHRAARLVSAAQALAIDESAAESTAVLEGDAQERRRQRRQVYDRRVIAKRPEGPSVLMGRDLSIGGIKIEPSDGLSLGTQVQIAVHGRQGTTPLVVDAKVTRDDGESGLVLEFENLDARRRGYLEKLVDELDAQEAPPADDIPF